ncbi:sugar phosphate permease [Desulfitobacterium sp. LBE]|uniref:Major facilitator superfamily MFS_1 n=1 Tax=Desulfitobacterium hafniense (strain DSM 10664 / DCB-2) TaxID=272564 RepID=B8G0V6_DESHD|nr:MULTISPECIES: MFS transporter [Desulfitobacterium]ACL18375.1 major facilitator superfamily MFS_1 [Desulfitobacterium hafniense DCB-2]TWH58697.1 sugar phosphate permease [Desulfitobacterium sp. LBE]
MSTATPNKSGGFHYAFVIAIACCGILGTVAALTFNAAGVFYGPVSSALGVGKGTFALYMSILLAVCTITLTFAGSWYSKYSARKILMAIVVINAAAFLLMSQATSVYTFYIAGGMMGFCQAFVLYLLAPTMIPRWFKKSAGTFIGIASAFTGVGAIIFNPIAGQTITNSGWQQGYLIYAITTLVIGLPCAFLIRNYPSDMGLKPYGDTGETVAATTAGLTGVSRAFVIKTVVFYVALLFAFCNAFVTNINFYIPVYSTSLGLALTVGATAASASMFGNMIGKFILGAVADKNVRGALFIGQVGSIAGILILYFLGPVNPLFIMGGAFLYAWANAVNSVVIPMVIKEAFGSRDYGKIISNISMALSFSSTIGSSAWGFIVDATNSYAYVFITSAVLMAVSLAAGNYVMNGGKKLPHLTAEQAAKANQ